MELIYRMINVSRSYTVKNAKHLSYNKLTPSSAHNNTSSLLFFYLDRDIHVYMYATKIPNG